MSTKDTKKQNNTKPKRKILSSLCTYSTLARKTQTINKIEPAYKIMS